VNFNSSHTGGNQRWITATLLIAALLHPLLNKNSSELPLFATAPFAAL